MKALLALFTLLSVFSLRAEDRPSDQPDLRSTPPEDFYWEGYFSSGDRSASSDSSRARTAAAILQRRLNELCEQYRALLRERNATEALALFDSMQEHWQKMADAEVAFVGTSWKGGSGARVAIPQHRFKVVLRRVKELRELKSDSLFLNQ